MTALYVKSTGTLVEIHSRGNVYTAVIYLKRALLLMHNYTGLPTDTMGLLNDMMGLVDCDEFTGFMNLVYFDHKKNTRIITHQEYL